MTLDLTKGRTGSVLLKYSLPLFASVIFQQLYNIADSFVAGKYLGENALAAVGNSYEVTLIYLSFAFGCNIGASVITARFFGSKRYKELKTAISTSFIMSIGVCILLMLLGFLFSPLLLHIINTPDNIFADTMTYINIYTLGLIFLFLYNITTGIFAAMGDSVTPFIFLSISSVVNIFMNIYFVKNLNMGIAGLAWATFICQSISCILSIIVLIKRLRKIEHGVGKAPLFSAKILKQIVVIAVPSTLQQCFISVGNIIIQGTVNSFGIPVMAGYTAAIKLNNFALTSFTTLGNAMSNFTSQNLGASETGRINEGYKAGFVIIEVVAIVFTALYLIFPSRLVSIFLPSESSSLEAIKSGTQFFHIIAPFYCLIAIKLISDGVLRGCGRMKEFMIATFADLTLRVILSKILSLSILPFGSTGIWLSWPLSWIIGMILSVIFYTKLKKENFGINLEKSL